MNSFREFDLLVTSLFSPVLNEAIQSPFDENSTPLFSSASAHLFIMVLVRISIDKNN